MDPDERRKRHELSHGVYNFRDVKVHFSKLGWTFRPGPPLSYDHYYIKPGKNPRNKEHKRGIDYFLGEAELVAYARKAKIFEEGTALSTNGLEHRKRRVRSRSSSSSTRAKPATLDVNCEGNKNESTQRIGRERKRHRRRIDENKVGNSALNPIALSSNSSDEDTGNESSGDRMDMARSSKDEEWTEGNSNVESEEEGDENVNKKAAKLANNKSRFYNENQREKRRPKANGKIQSSTASKFEAEWKPASDGSDAEKTSLNYQKPRPLLTTSHSKRSAKMHSLQKQHETKSKAFYSHAKGPCTPKSKNNAAVGLALKHARESTFYTGKRPKSSSQSFLPSTDNIQGSGFSDNDDNISALGVAEYSGSPPRRPPSKVHSRAKRNNFFMARTAVAASLTSNEQQDENLSACYPLEQTDGLVPVAVLASRLPTTNGISARTSTLLKPEKSRAENVNSAQLSMELTQVVLPPEYDKKYHIKVTMSADKTPVYTIWMQDLSSHEQREYSFVDVMELPGAKNYTRVPTRSVLTALFRCLSSQIDAVVIAGPEPRATAKSKSASEKGEVHLLTSTAEKKLGEANGGSDDELALVVTYPALDLFRIEHTFPMKLVPTNLQVRHLAMELERLKQQLLLVKTDRDKLCEQLRQQEEENERKLSQQVEVQVQAKMKAYHIQQRESHTSEDIECRVANHVKKIIKAPSQMHEIPKRN